jgi:hypothetical protein
MHRTIKNKGYLLLIVILAFSLTQMVTGQVTTTPSQTAPGLIDESTQPTQTSPAAEPYPFYTIPMNLYVQASVCVNFLPTTTRDINVTSRYGSSDTEIASNNFVTCSMLYVDTYTIHISVRYAQWTEQTVTVSFRSGNLTAADNEPQPLEYYMNSRGFDFYLIIKTSVAPSYPSAEEVAEAQQQYFNEGINNAIQHMDEVTAADRNLVQLNLIFGVPAVTIAIACIILYLRQRDDIIRLKERAGGK